MTGLRIVAQMIIVLIAVASCMDSGRESSGTASQPDAPVIEATESTPGNDRQPADSGANDASDNQVAVDTAETPVTEASAANADNLNLPLKEKDVTGSWIGLFGRHDMGIIERAWEDGHRIEVLDDGQAIWTRLSGGVAVSSMDSQWSLSGDRLTLSFPAGVAEKSGLAGIAPLGLDQLQGSNEQGGAGSFDLTDKTLNVVVYPSFMVLSDGHGRLMVYGRTPLDAPPVGSSLGGQWQLAAGVGGNQQVDVGFRGDRMLINNWPSGSFAGDFVEGYFTGRIEQPGKISFAAFTHNGNTDGAIHGMVCEGPLYGVADPVTLLR